MVHEDFERSEVGFLSIGLGMVLWGCLWMTPEAQFWFFFGKARCGAGFSPLSSPVRAIDCVLGRILDLDVFLVSREDVPHLGDFMFHQVLVEGVGDLQPTYERRGSHIVIAVIDQGHLSLKIIDKVFETLPGFHLDHDEVIVVFL